MTPFSLRIFVADGDPDGLRIVEKSNWIGKALVFPRALLPQVKVRSELAQTGVYLLLGPRPDGEGDMLYVGDGDPIRPRLESHYAQKDFWTRAIGFRGTGQKHSILCACNPAISRFSTGNSQCNIAGRC
jgi:hypothetical protein